jgi:hypothetical protein
VSRLATAAFPSIRYETFDHTIRLIRYVGPHILHDLRSYVPDDPSQVEFCASCNWGYLRSTIRVSARTPSWNPNSKTLEIYRQQHDRPANRVIAQHDSSNNFSLRFHSGNEKFGVKFRNVTIWFFTFFFNCASNCVRGGVPAFTLRCRRLITFLSCYLVTAVVCDVCPTCSLNEFHCRSFDILPFIRPAPIPIRYQKSWYSAASDCHPWSTMHILGTWCPHLGSQKISYIT